MQIKVGYKTFYKILSFQFFSFSVILRSIFNIIFFFSFPAHVQMPVWPILFFNEDLMLPVLTFY